MGEKEIFTLRQRLLGIYGNISIFRIQVSSLFCKGKGTECLNW